ncbi:MAG: hypothetical protein QOJ26_1029 [Thermoplasmata archaeon]|nr:hypothetical protein [Thermoplasmata archaeon]
MGRFLISACLALLASLVAIPMADANICTAAAGCEFWDSNYHEVILYTVDTADIDVIIIPPVSATTIWDQPAMESAVANWDAGINAMAPAWLGAGLTIHSYTLGTDTPPQSALTDPEIVVFAAAYNPVLLFGIGEQVPVSICRQQSNAMVGTQHIHDGWVLEQSSCADGGAQCLAINTNFLTGTTNEMYDLVAHEFGHCLGVGHVGDAGDFDAKTVPMNDIMSYQHGAHVHCVSSLNILALQGVYADILGQPGQLQPFDYVSQSPSSYSQTTCSDPPEGLWVAASMDADLMKPVDSLQSFAPETPVDGLLALAIWDPTELLVDTPFAGLF